ncbi:hypothetical protein COCMIDRAFT_104564, partial [Bipolaris oryzae ATCC 44560]
FLYIAISQITFLPKISFIGLATGSIPLAHLSRSMKKNIMIFLSLAIHAGAKCIPIYTCVDPADLHCQPGKGSRCNWHRNIDDTGSPCPTKRWKCFDGECHNIIEMLNGEKIAKTCYVMCCENESDSETL